MIKIVSKDSRSILSFMIIATILFNGTTSVVMSQKSSLDTSSSSLSPVEVGKEYDVEIQDIGREGNGIARVEGFVIYVPETKVGDKLRIQVDKVMRRFAIGHKIKMLGAVKFFNTKKNYGSIAGDDDRDYFVYGTDIMPGISLTEGDRVSFNVEEAERGPKAHYVIKVSNVTKAANVTPVSNVTKAANVTPVSNVTKAANVTAMGKLTKAVHLIGTPDC